MKKIILLVLISITLFAQENISSGNPKVYAALGDVIYNNLSSIEELKNIKFYEKFSLKISKYAYEVKETKKLGFDIESGRKDAIKLQYLTKLRELSKENDFFVKSANDNLKSSIKNGDNKLFTEIVNSGLIDIKKHRVKIINYYKANSKDIEPSGILKNILDEENAKKQKNRYNSSKLDKEKIERIRRLDKAKQKDLEKKLEKEVKLKKKKIREEQERELIN